MRSSSSSSSSIWASPQPGDVRYCPTPLLCSARYWHPDAISLRACYAMSGTGVAFAAPSREAQASYCAKVSNSSIYHPIQCPELTVTS
eukprot:2328773-Rhodomonas_salina.1